MTENTQLTHESREAIRAYLLKMIAIPATVLMVLSFLVGFFIKDVALTKAHLEASNEVSKITQEAWAKVHKLTEDVYKSQSVFTQKIADKRVEASKTLDSITKLSDKVKETRSGIQILESIKTVNSLSDNIADILKKDPEFQGKVAQRTANLVEPLIKDKLPKVHFEEWNLENETGVETKWSPLPTDMRISIESGQSTLVVMGDISRVQHKSANTNTEYRIIVDGKEVSRTNSGGHLAFEYKALSLFGVVDVSEGSHYVRVEYKTQKGVEYWGSSERGLQQRRLIVLEMPQANK